MKWTSGSRTCLAAMLLLCQLCPVLLQAADLSEQLREQLSSKERVWAEQNLDWPKLQAFYFPEYRPVWIQQSRPLSRTMQWWQILQAAETEGLEPKRYHQDDIEQYWQADTVEQQAWLELLLTDAFLHYSKHVRNGRLKPEVVDPNWHITAPDTDTVGLLRNILAAEDFTNAVKALAPQHAGYRRLREALAQYRQLAGKPDWPVIPTQPKLYWGVWHDNIPLLRRRLILTGDLSARKVQEPRFFDQRLRQAVEHFQRRHGLKSDGVVGAATFTRLNTPLREHVRQIKLNMERWRWLPRELGDRYVMVNTASYQLHVIDHGKPRLAMRVITGTAERPTPVVGGRMQSLIINPYWYIPQKIAVEDLIPKQVANPQFFKSNRIHVMLRLDEQAREIDPTTIDWGQIDRENFPYRLRQEPGPGNSLGNIKFPFLNNFAIYLHDTPARYLFNYTKRAFSSGCVRVEDPLRLASYLLNGEQGWTLAKLQEKIDTGETLTVGLPRPVPIYLVYWTVWVGADNTVYFQKDIYDRDRPMADCG